jgi:hypothetical protein
MRSFAVRDGQARLAVIGQLRRRHVVTRHHSVVFFALLSFGLAASAEAHHAGAMFDATKSVTLAGTVREFQWTSPHCFIQLMETTPAGLVEWSIEMGAPVQLTRLGWKKTTLKPGDKATITVHPLQDGGKGGLFVSGMDGGGQRLGGSR